jgi:hypothetical protein
MKQPATGGVTPQSGIYQPSNGGKEIAVSLGDRLPPSRGVAVTYRLVRATK